jgi:hypothetical protein
LTIAASITRRATFGFFHGRSAGAPAGGAFFNLTTWAASILGRGVAVVALVARLDNAIAAGLDRRVNGRHKFRKMSALAFDKILIEFNGGAAVEAEPAHVPGLRPDVVGARSAVPRLSTFAYNVPVDCNPHFDWGGELRHSNLRLAPTVYDDQGHG